MDSSSDEEPLETAAPSRAPRAGRAKAPVKYFVEESEDEESDEKEEEISKGWSLSDSDFDGE